MENIPLVLSLWILYLLTSVLGSTAFYHGEHDNTRIKYTYIRSDQVEKECASVLSSAAELKTESFGGDTLKDELSFFNGDWIQVLGESPLFPFDDSGTPTNGSGSDSNFKLASFWLMNVDPICRFEKAVSVSGMMLVGLTKRVPFTDRPRNWLPRFEQNPGISRLTILFEGIYFESKDGADRFLCMLGNGKLPHSIQSGSHGKHTNECCNSKYLNECCKEYEGYQPPAVQDDQIVLVLRYPKNFSLTARGIKGELRSLNKKQSLAYFDKVHISSQRGDRSTYLYGSEALLSKACIPYPYVDNLEAKEVKMFTGDGYCHNLKNLVQHETFIFLPELKSDHQTSNDPTRFGPFIIGRKEIVAEEYLDNLRLVIQDLQCEEESAQRKIKTARVSAVFRVVYQWEDDEIVKHRTGLSGMTLSAEGTWRSDSGQLCMVGCVELVGSITERCNSRICLHIPTTFSIKQRSMVFGSISSINKTNSPKSIYFENVLDNLKVKMQWDRNLKWSYKYSKIHEAIAFEMRSKPSTLAAIFKKMFFRYASLTDSDISSYSNLSEELINELGRSFLSIGRTSKTYIQVEILSVGSFVRQSWHQFQGYNPEFPMSSHSIARSVEVSGRIRIKGEHNVSFFLEGLYNPTVGEMYLIGCRDVKGFKKFIPDAANLEEGMDCLVEVKIIIPTKNARWLLNPQVKIFINSQRSDDDPLYITPISFKAERSYLVMTLAHIRFRKCFEGLLQILFLIVEALCTLKQLSYAKKMSESAACISLVMLSVQALHYGIGLIGDPTFLFNWKLFEFHEGYSYGHMMFPQYQVIVCIIKILLLASLLLH